MADRLAFFLLTDSDIDQALGLLRTALAACGQANPQITVCAPARDRQAVRTAYRAARAARGAMVHALLSPELRRTAQFVGRHLNVPTVDLMGPVIVRLTDLLELQPSDNPDLFSSLDEEYFRRIEAIEFAVGHDDGLRPYELGKAELVLVGVSRTSKTPLSMYLATHGWLVANVPLVVGTEPPDELFEIDPHKVFALTIRPERLALLRQVRLTRLGMAGPPSYADLTYVRDDVHHAQEIFRRGGWAILDVTSKAIEESANEILQMRSESQHSGS